MISIKTKIELDLMRESGRILASIISKMRIAAKPGITTKDLDKLARELVLFHDVKAAFLGYSGFPAVVCISMNDEVVHGVPSGDKLKEGDLLSIDMGVVYKGFYSDSAVTFPVLGNMSESEWSQKNPEASKLLAVTKEALNVGIKNAKAGNHVGDISSEVQKVIERNNFGVVRVLVGHGIGRDLHEEPQVPNFGEPGDGPELKTGMTIAIEPMVNVGSHEIELTKDGFTYKTKDGSLSAHFEHTVVITEDGPEILTQE